MLHKELRQTNCWSLIPPWPVSANPGLGACQHHCL